MTHSHARSLAMAATVAAVGLAACGDDRDTTKTTSKADAGEAIVIKTQLSIPTGRVVRGSAIGGRAFCAGGTFRDQESGTGGPPVTKTFSCDSGRLTISFMPGAAKPDADGGRTQSGTWKIVTGSGQFQGLRGRGAMVVHLGKPSAANAAVVNGRETFTGTVTRPTAEKGTGS